MLSMTVSMVVISSRLRFEAFAATPIFCTLKNSTVDEIVRTTIIAANATISLVVILRLFMSRAFIKTARRPSLRLPQGTVFGHVG